MSSICLSSSKMKKSYVGYIVALIIGLVFCGIYAYTGGLFTAATAHEALLALCHSLEVPAIVLIGIGLLTWASSKGAYDMISYGFSTVFMPFANMFRGEKTEYKKFYDYKMEKEEKRKPWLKEMLIVGLGFLAVYLVVLVIYYIVGE